MKSFAGKTIRVTLKDIEKGKRCNSDKCPIALAIRKNAKGKHVCVGPYYIHIGKESFYTPDKAETFIIKFDSGLGFKKKAFTFNMPKKSIQNIQNGTSN